VSLESIELKQWSKANDLGGFLLKIETGHSDQRVFSDLKAKIDHFDFLNIKGCPGRAGDLLDFCLFHHLSTTEPQLRPI
jgi:hypothetical protein